MGGTGAKNGLDWSDRRFNRRRASYVRRMVAGSVIEMIEVLGNAASLVSLKTDPLPRARKRYTR